MSGLFYLNSPIFARGKPKMQHQYNMQNISIMANAFLLNWKVHVTQYIIFVISICYHDWNNVMINQNAIWNTSILMNLAKTKGIDIKLTQWWLERACVYIIEMRSIFSMMKNAFKEMITYVCAVPRNPNQNSVQSRCHTLHGKYFHISEISDLILLYHNIEELHCQYLLLTDFLAKQK